MLTADAHRATEAVSAWHCLRHPPNVQPPARSTAADARVLGPGAVSWPSATRRTVDHSRRPTGPACPPSLGWLIAEGGIPRRIKSAFLSDDDAADLAAYAVLLRGKTHRDDAA